MPTIKERAVNVYLLSAQLALLKAKLSLYATSDQGGVWRTVNGRHIFIADGESVQSAMEKSLGGDRARTPEQHRSAMSYHAQMVKRAANAGKKGAMRLHEKALEAHSTAWEKGGSAKDARASSIANITSDQAHNPKEFHR